MTTEQRIKRSYMAQKRYAKLLGLLLLALFVLAPVWAVSTTEKRLTAQSVSVLEHSGIDASQLSISFSGRDATLVAKSGERVQIERAAALVQKVPGVRHVETQLIGSRSAPDLHVRDKSEPALEKASLGTLLAQASVEPSATPPATGEAPSRSSGSFSPPPGPNPSGGYTFRPVTQDPEEGSAMPEAQTSGSPQDEGAPGSEAPVSPAPSSATEAPSSNEQPTTEVSKAATPAPSLTEPAPPEQTSNTEEATPEPFSAAQQTQVIAYLNQLVASTPGFIGGSNRLHPAAQGALVRIAEVLRRYPEFPLAVVAYAGSSRGSYWGQGQVSPIRTEIVYRMLTDQGVSGQRLIALGPNRYQRSPPHRGPMRAFPGQIQFLSIPVY